MRITWDLICVVFVLTLLPIMPPEVVVVSQPSQTAYVFSCGDVTEIPILECQALVALYESANGPGWIDSTNWLITNTPSNWYGVMVEGGHVVELSLPDNHLTGYMPAELGNLSQLRKLQLCDYIMPASSNALAGPIPPELGNLHALEKLYLEHNELSGPIPPELGGLTNLTMLILQDNRLTGGIPASLGALTKVRYLDLGWNQLDGSIPPQLGSLTSLEYLYLGGNELSGPIPPHLGNLTGLRGAELQLNHLSGPIPPELGNLRELQFIYLSGNMLTGAIPQEIGNLSDLRALYLQGNALEGPIPRELTNLVNLNISPYVSGGMRARSANGLASDGMGTENWTDLGYNKLWSDDPLVTAFLGEKDPDWADTQTVPVADLAIASLDDTSISLSWKPVIYTQDGGYYQVEYSRDPGGPYTVHGHTDSKDTARYVVDGLNADTTYYLVVRSYTPPHGYQQNHLFSRYSGEVTARTETTETLKGYVWIDSNGDGERQHGEGLSGVVVTLDPEGTAALRILAQRETITDAGGYYRFDAVLPGAHQLRFSDPQQRFVQRTLQVTIPENRTAPTQVDLDSTRRVSLPVLMRPG